MSETSTNVQIRLRERPEGAPSAATFETTREAAPEIGEGQVLVRNLMLSLDPAMRGWISDRKSYIEPVGLGDVMRGLTVGEVAASRHDAFAVGDRVSGSLGWQEWAAAEARELQKLPPEGPLEWYLGPLGMTGLTAYFGLLDIADLREGDIVLVSAAAGAVGSVVGQIAKIKGCRVIGTAGTDEKCAWIRDELGFDAAINYKRDDLDAALREAAPKGIDVYFDNVGGELLDLALRLLRRGARIALCGAISQYNAMDDVRGPSNYLSLLVNRARIEGFIVFDFAPRYGEALAELGQWVQDGKIQARFEIVEGLENAPQALGRLFDGSKSGKLVVRIAQPAAR
ncbi:MAG: NADP-dependent oxidoreductase [Acidobacteriota bacterium]